MGKIKDLDNKALIYLYVEAQLDMAYDTSRRGKKKQLDKIEKLGNEIVKRGLLLEDDAEKLLYY